MAFARFVLVLLAFVYGIVALAFLASPASFAALVDISLTSTTADNDFRAVYGGVSLGIALFFVASLSRADWFRPALTAGALIFLCMVGARVLSWALAGFPDSIAYGLQLVEAAGFILAVVALRGLPKANPAS